MVHMFQGRNSFQHLARTKFLVSHLQFCLFQIQLETCVVCRVWKELKDHQNIVRLLNIFYKPNKCRGFHRVEDRVGIDSLWYNRIYTWMKTGEMIRDFRFLCFILLSQNDDLPCRHQGFIRVLLATSLIFWGDDGTNPPPAYPSNCCKPTEFLRVLSGIIKLPI